MQFAVILTDHAVERMRDRLMPVISDDPLLFIERALEEHLRGEAVLENGIRRVRHRVGDVIYTFVCRFMSKGKCEVITMYWTQDIRWTKPPDIKLQEAAKQARRRRKIRHK